MPRSALVNRSASAGGKIPLSAIVWNGRAGSAWPAIATAPATAAANLPDHIRGLTPGCAQMLELLLLRVSPSVVRVEKVPEAPANAIPSTEVIGPKRRSSSASIAVRLVPSVYGCARMLNHVSPRAAINTVRVGLIVPGVVSA